MPIARPGARDQVVLKFDERRARLGDEKQTRRLLIEAMDELEELGRPGAPHLLDHAEALAAATVHGHAGGLVDADDRLVLVNDGELPPRCFGPLAAIGDAHGRNPNLVAERQARVGRRPALVDPHFTRADDAVQMRARDSLQDLGKKVVEALAIRAAVDADVSHDRRGVVLASRRRPGRGGRGAAFAPYNALLHSRPSC